MAPRQKGTGSVYQRARDKRWVGTIEAGWTREGARRRITVTGKTEGEVKRRIRDKMRELDRGASTETKRTTVKAYAEKWTQITATDVRPNTAVADGSALKWIVETLGHLSISQVGPDDVRRLRTVLVEEKGRSTSTALRYHGVLIRMLKAAQADGYDIKPAALSTKPPKKAINDRGSIPVPEAIKILGAAMDLEHGSRWAAAFLEGVRPAEALGLTWDMVDFEKGTMTICWQLQPIPYKIKRDRSSGFKIPDGYEARQLGGRMHLVRPKSKAGWRTIPMVPWMRDALLQWKAVAPESPHGLVWPAADGGWRDENDDRAEFDELQKAAGVKHTTGRYYDQYETRHTCASILIALRVPDTIRIAIIGHATTASTKTYEHADQAMMLEALNEVAERLNLTPREVRAIEAKEG